MAVPSPRSAGKDAEWTVYGGNDAGQRFSPLRQIAKGNVRQLAEAWRFDTGPGGLQTQPLIVGGVLYACTPGQAVFALDAATGRQLWQFKPDKPGYQPVRGLSYWQSGAERRLFAVNGYWLYALDPETGQPVRGFGTGGRIDLRQGLGQDPEKLAVFMTSPGVVYRDVIITGFRTGEAAPAAPGAVRAFDVRTGALRWKFDTIPADGDPAAAGWVADQRRIAGGANNWAGMALDAARGIVYVPTGSAVSDFYGAQRLGDNLYANSLLALDAATGKRLWHFQTVHHDLWDRDLPSPPTLLRVRREGREVDAVVQPSKLGFLYLFDRVTGKPLFPIVETPVARSTVPGEQSAPTQPIPALPTPLVRQSLTEDLLTTRTPAAHAAVLSAFRTYRSEGLFTPLETGRKTVSFPGSDGGAEWGGGAVDPRKGIFYINAQDVPWLGRLRPNRATDADPGKLVFERNCAACHGAEGKGNPPDFPALTGLSQRLSRSAVEAVIVGGRGRMPGFPQLSPAEREALLGHLMPETRADGLSAAAGAMPRTMIEEFRKLGGDQRDAYLYEGYERFRDPDGYPAVKPPWGTLSAIDLNTGRYLWKIPLGEYPELVAAGMGVTGSENYGGPLLTGSGLLFIGATIYDRKFRAFDAASGALLWETVLPYAGTATPATYTVRGRQFIVIATSGGRDPRGPKGSAYVAFALPK